jgi:hypothetical protein
LGKNGASALRLTGKNRTFGAQPRAPIGQSLELRGVVAETLDMGINLPPKPRM